MPEEHLLYHYTDYQALDGIVGKAQLRLNNLLNMNDAAEMRLFMGGLSTAVMERLQRDGAHDTWKAVRALFHEELKKVFYYSAYAACFSKNRDDAAQWERYGNHGRGVCIAFSKELLQKMAVGVVSLEEVYYQADMRSHKLVDTFYKLVKDASGDLKKNPRIMECLEEAWIASAAFKHPSFASEKEMRLVASPFSKKYFDVKPCYHISTERIKKYYPLDLRKMCEYAACSLEDAIHEIMIGPESTQSKSILEDYLKDTGMEKLAGKVVISDCPLRRSYTSS